MRLRAMTRDRDACTAQFQAAVERAQWLQRCLEKAQAAAADVS